MLQKRWMAMGLALVAGMLVAGSTVRAEEAKPDADGFISLFDGKTLDGWDGGPDFWKVENGVIVGQTTKEKPTKGNTFLIWKGGEVADFELVVSWKMENHNSGIQYRSKQYPSKEGDANKWVVGGYQADMDEKNTYTGICYEERGRGILVKRGEKLLIGEDGKKTVEGKVDEKEIIAALKPGDWNTWVITCKGNKCVQKLNGVVTADFTDNQPGKAAAKGIIAFQLHAGPPMKVCFKDIKLKKLDAK